MSGISTSIFSSVRTFASPILSLSQEALWDTPVSALKTVTAWCRQRTSMLDEAFPCLSVLHSPKVCHFCLDFFSNLPLLACSILAFSLQLLLLALYPPPHYLCRCCNPPLHNAGFVKQCNMFAPSSALCISLCTNRCRMSFSNQFIS